MVIKKYEDLFKNLEKINPPEYLSKKILVTIKREKELRKIKRQVFGLMLLFVVLFSVLPYSYLLLVQHIKESGIIYFLKTAFYDLKISYSSWQEIILATLESLPIFEILMFLLNLIFLILTAELILSYKNKLLKPNY